MGCAARVQGQLRLRIAVRSGPADVVKLEQSGAAQGRGRLADYGRGTAAIGIARSADWTLDVQSVRQRRGAAQPDHEAVERYGRHTQDDGVERVRRDLLPAAGLDQ